MLKHIITIAIRSMKRHKSSFAINLTGLSTGLAFSFLLYLWLEDVVYRVNISWWIFIAAETMALVIAWLMVSFQAIKAAIANPVQSLRTE